MLLALARGGDSRRPAPSGSAAVSSGSALESREDVLRLAATAVDAALLASGDGSSSDPLWTAVKHRQCAKLQETVQQLAAAVVGGGGAATSPEPPARPHDSLRRLTLRHHHRTMSTSWVALAVAR